MKISNEERISSIQEYLKGYKEFVDTKGGEMDGFISVFDDNDVQPLIMYGLPFTPPTTKERSLMALLPMGTVPFIKGQAVAYTNDVWFVKKDKDSTDIDELKTISPSAHIDRQQALMTLLIDKQLKGVHNICEYGRDDNGKMYWSNSNFFTVDYKNVDDEEIMQSWMVDLAKTIYQFDLLEKENVDDTLMLESFFDGLHQLSHLNYTIVMRPDFADYLIKQFPNADANWIMEQVADGVEEE